MRKLGASNLLGSSVMFCNKTFFALCVGICLESGVPHSVAAQSSTSRIELSQLIQMYMLPKQVSYNVLPWDTGSAPGIPISWRHTGITDCDTYLVKEFGGPFRRSGQVVVTVGGKPTHTVLGRVVEPGNWQVILAGARAGVTYVIIDSSVLSQELSSGVLQAAVSKARNGIQLSHIKSCGSVSGGSEQFRVTVPGKENAFVREWWSCGSGGCNAIITLAPNLEDGKRLANCSP